MKYVKVELDSEFGNWVYYVREDLAADFLHISKFRPTSIRLIELSDYVIDVTNSKLVKSRNPLSIEKFVEQNINLTQE